MLFTSYHQRVLEGKGGTNSRVLLGSCVRAILRRHKLNLLASILRRASCSMCSFAGLCKILLMLCCPPTILGCAMFDFLCKQHVHTFWVQQRTCPAPRPSFTSLSHKEASVPVNLPLSSSQKCYFARALCPPGQFNKAIIQ